MASSGKVRAASGSETHERASRGAEEFWERQASLTTQPQDGRDEAFQRDLLRMAGHDLRIPLKVLKRNVQFLTDPRSSPELRDKAKRVLQRIASRLDFLLEDILAIAETGSTDFTLNQTRFDLAELVQQSVETYSGLASDLGRRSAVQVDGPLPVEGDKLRLAQVCMNVLTEAIWATPTGGEVDVVTNRDGRFAVLRILCSPGERDTETAAEDRRLAEANEGSLGLHLARAIAVQHGGSLAIDRDALGGERTFTLRIPLATPTGAL